MTWIRLALLTFGTAGLTAACAAPAQRVYSNGSRRPANTFVSGTYGPYGSRCCGASRLVADTLPPAPLDELVPPSPGLDAYWIPGYWDWNGVDWIWIPGHWEAAPAGGFVWIGPNYVNYGSYCEYTPGYWQQEDPPAPVPPPPPPPAVGARPARRPTRPTVQIQPAPAPREPSITVHPAPVDRVPDPQPVVVSPRFEPSIVEAQRVRPRSELVSPPPLRDLDVPRQLRPSAPAHALPPTTAIPNRVAPPPSRAIPPSVMRPLPPPAPSTSIRALPPAQSFQPHKTPPPAVQQAKPYHAPVQQKLEAPKADRPQVKALRK